jgi:putative DNA primase/helicase
MAIVIKKPVVVKKTGDATQPQMAAEPGIVINFPIGMSNLGVELTEDAVAEAFAQTYLDTLRFDHTRGKWFVWNGSRWDRNDTGLAFDYARKLCRKYRKDQLRMSSRKAAEGVELMAQRDQRLAVESEDWDRDPFLLGTPGGTVDLKTGMLQPAAREHYITKLTSVTPAAMADCPLFRKFLAEATAGNEELQGFMQRWAGYCLTADTSEHALLLICGPGGNGKGVLKNVMTEISGDYAATAGMDTFAATKHRRHLTELAVLDGARLVAVSETEHGQAWSETRINQFTGGDLVTANFMRQDAFTYRPKLKLMIIANHKPKLTSVNDAARRRFNIVPFTHKPSEVDKQLGEKLRPEYPGILRWMIDGALAWRKNGLGCADIVGATTADYFEEQDQFGRWLEEKCNCSAGLEASATDLYGSWKTFATDNGEDAGSSTGFAARMGERGFDKKKSGKVYYLRIELKNGLAA